MAAGWFFLSYFLVSSCLPKFLEGLLAARYYLPFLLVHPEQATRPPFLSSAWIKGVSGPIKLSVGLSVRVSNVDPLDKLVSSRRVVQIVIVAEPSGEHKVGDHPSGSPGSCSWDFLRPIFHYIGSKSLLW
ncbi:hypothetical protein QBC36DRAFT_32573 [Triangularia setosa]|uniref:Secreted protein n=1 Tax=Triangularia setosa TaxID=2587417 RepID=A0AAN6W7D6_9PEZI|nr:hypothetical protein QBC36DRAFT_32573 [Podospora setosa]